MIRHTGSISWQGAIIPSVMATNILWLWTSPVSHEAPHVLSPPHVTRRRIIFSVLSRTQSPGDNWRPGRNFSFKPRPLSTGWSLSLDSSGWRWPALSAYYLYFRYIVVSPWQWDQVTDGESGGGMRHNANTVTLRSHPAVPGPGARLFCETHSARASPPGWPQHHTLHWDRQSVPCFDFQTRDAGRRYVSFLEICRL